MVDIDSTTGGPKSIPNTPPQVSNAKTPNPPTPQPKPSLAQPRVVGARNPVLLQDIEKLLKDGGMDSMSTIKTLQAIDKLLWG